MDKMIVLVVLILGFALSFLVLNNLPNWIRYNQNLMIMTIIIWFAIFSFLFYHFAFKD